MTGPDVPRLRRREKRRETKGAGVVSGQGGVAGVNAEFLVPGPLVQAGKVLLGLGGAAGTAPPSALKAAASFVMSKLPALLAAALTGSAVCCLYQMFKPGPSVLPKQENVFRSGLKPLDEPRFGGGSGAEAQDSLSYLIAGNHSTEDLRDSLAVQQNLRQAAMMPPEPALPPAAVPPRADPEALVPQEKAAPDVRTVEAGKAAVPGTTWAGGIGMWEGITRKFDPNSDIRLGRGRVLAGAASAFTAQQSPYRGRRGMSSSSRRGSSNALKQLFSVHQRSRQALGQGSAEAKAASAAQAFGSAKGQSGPIRSSAKRGTAGAESNPFTFDMGDGGPISTPFSGKSGAPSPGQTGDVSPWTPDIQRAKDKLQDASSLITAIGILAPFKMLPIVGPIVMMVQGILYSMAASYSSTAKDIGSSIQSNYAQPQQSDIVTTGSAITDAAAAAAMAAPVSMTAWASVLAGVAGIAALVGVLLASKR